MYRYHYDKQYFILISFYIIMCGTEVRQFASESHYFKTSCDWLAKFGYSVSQSFTPWDYNKLYILNIIQHRLYLSHSVVQYIMMSLLMV